jgi:hypothetical protein
MVVGGLLFLAHSCRVLGFGVLLHWGVLTPRG